MDIKIYKISGLFLKTLLLFFMLWHSQINWAAADILKLSGNAREQGTGAMPHLAGLDGIFANAAASSLTSAQTWQLAGTYQQFIQEINYFNGSGLINLQQWGTLAAGVSYLDYGTIESEGSSFSLNESIFMANYARQIFSFHFGLNAKYLSQQIGTYQASTFAFDAGLLKSLTILQHQLFIGLAATNLGKPLKFNQGESALPSLYGAALSVSLQRYLPRYLDLLIGSATNYHIENENQSFSMSSELAISMGKSAFKINSAYDFLPDGSNQFSFGASFSMGLSNYTSTVMTSYSPGQAANLTSSPMISAQFSQIKEKKKPKLREVKHHLVDAAIEDTELAAKLHLFLRQYCLFYKTPKNLNEVIEKYIAAGNPWFQLTKGQIIYFPQLTKIIYFSRHSVKNHQFLVGQSVLNGRIIKASATTITIKNQYGTMKLSKKNINRANDETLSQKIKQLNKNKNITPVKFFVAQAKPAGQETAKEKQN